MAGGLLRKPKNNIYLRYTFENLLLLWNDPPSEAGGIEVYSKVPNLGAKENSD